MRHFRAVVTLYNQNNKSVVRNEVKSAAVLLFVSKEARILLYYNE